MMMGLAATDSLTKYRPYLSIDLSEWICVWLGLNYQESIQLAASLLLIDGALISCGQFVPRDLIEMNWRMIKIATLEGIGFTPLRSKQPGVELIVPFDTANGLPGFLAVQAKNEETKIRSNALGSLLHWYRGIANPNNFPIIPVALSVAQGRGMKELGQPVDSDFESPHACIGPGIAELCLT